MGLHVSQLVRQDIFCFSKVSYGASLEMFRVSIKCQLEDLQVYRCPNANQNQLRKKAKARSTQDTQIHIISSPCTVVIVCVCVSNYVCTSSAYKLYDLCIYIYIYIYIRMYIAMICTYYINIFIVLWWCFMYLCNGMAAHISNVMISHIIGVALLTRDAQLPQPTGPPDSNQLASGIKIEEATLLMPSYWSMWANEVALSEATLSNRQIYE